MAYTFLLTPELHKHKKNRVLRQSRGYFIDVICGECSEQTVCYSHSQHVIHCPNCSTQLLKPSGGAAILTGKAVKKNAITENNY